MIYIIGSCGKSSGVEAQQGRDQKPKEGGVKGGSTRKKFTLSREDKKFYGRHESKRTRGLEIINKK
jgi:hypothetical protein